MSTPDELPADATLGDRLLMHIGQIARRDDVVVHVLQVGPTMTHGTKLDAWAEVLPKDMHAFFTETNGLVFRYAFVDQPMALHGFRLLALDPNGHDVRDAAAGRPSWSRAKVKDYPEGVFQTEGGIPEMGEWPADPEAEALFFEGESDSGGHVLFGRGETVTLSCWTNDGWVEPLKGKTFTAFIEDLLATGLTPRAIGHPETRDRLERLSRPAADRPVIAVHVRGREDLTESAARAKLLGPCTKPQVAALVKALGKAKSARGDRDAMMAAIDEACAQGIGADLEAGVRAALKLPWISDGAGRVPVSYLLFAGTGPVASLELEAESLLPALAVSSVHVHDVLATLPTSRLREWHALPPALQRAPRGASGEPLTFRYSAVKTKWHPTKVTLLIPAAEAQDLQPGRTIHAATFGAR